MPGPAEDTLHFVVHKFLPQAPVFAGMADICLMTRLGPIPSCIDTIQFGESGLLGR